MTVLVQYGKLPPIPDRPALMLRTLGIVPTLPVPPAEVHNIELVPDPDMLGNDAWGDCVFVSIENNRRIAAAALGVPIVRMTAQQVVDQYCAYTGTHTPPGPGAVIQTALEWVRRRGWGGNQLLAFARVPLTELAIREAVAEFASCAFGVVIRAGEEYPSRVWNSVTGTVDGGHGVAGGTYVPSWVGCKTWGYLAEMTSHFVENGGVDEVDVLVWDFQWASLSYDRQVTLITDYQALTGKTWTGPAPIPPNPTPEVNVFLLPKPVRIFEGAVSANTAKKIAIAGVQGIPSNATGIVAIIRVFRAGANGWVYVGPDQGVAPTVSTMEFEAGKVPDGYPIVGLTNGQLTIYSTVALARFIVDITGYLA